MSYSLEMALRLFSPKGALHEPISGNFNALRRDELIGALHMAAKDNPLGLQYLMADHLVDPQAIEGLLAHFSTNLGSDEVGAMALAILLRRPLPEQLERLVLSHPYYDKERRRAAVVAGRPTRGGAAAGRLQARQGGLRARLRARQPARLGGRAECASHRHGG